MNVESLFRESPDRMQLIACIQQIASIPWGEARTVEDVLTFNKGTCTGKHLVLQSKLDALGQSGHFSGLKH